MNAISKLNEYNQKNGLPPSKYTFIADNGVWICILDGESATATSKSEAKLLVSQLVLDKIINIRNVYTAPENTRIMIDGDQRVDCWRWINSVSLTNVILEIFVNPTSHVEPLSNGSTLHISNSTSRDSVDADILITLGAAMMADKDYNIIIVSSDHILVQAAIDYGLKYAKNVEMLKSHFI